MGHRSIGVWEYESIRAWDNKIAKKILIFINF